jgi:hypothetical protein
MDLPTTRFLPLLVVEEEEEEAAAAGPRGEV